MVTVENNRIRVTVTQDIWDSYAETARSLARTQGGARAQEPEEILRGLILSDAMKKLGNASEVKALESGAPGDTATDGTTAHALARSLLMRHYLNVHCNVVAEEMLRRQLAEQPMSEWQRDQLDEAEAYADGLLEPLSDVIKSALAGYAADAMRAGRNPTREELYRCARRAEMQDVGLRGEAAQAVEAATRTLGLIGDLDLSYRRACAKMDGWQIEVIGEMPAQIGTCRYDKGVGTQKDPH